MAVRLWNLPVLGLWNPAGLPPSGIVQSGQGPSGIVPPA